jgi:hypothetical protein
VIDVTYGPPLHPPLHWSWRESPHIGASFRAFVNALGVAKAYQPQPGDAWDDVSEATLKHQHGRAEWWDLRPLERTLTQDRNGRLNR